MGVKYNKVLLKLSGEALAGDKTNAIDSVVIGRMCDEIKKVVDLGVEVSIVVGGGNFWRGRYSTTIDRATSDYMGMLGTAMNALAIQSELEARGVSTEVQTAIEMSKIADPYIRRNALAHLKNKGVVVFACGTGNPYFSTDTAAALRAAEVGADVILFAKTIDGVYSDDPKTNPNAVKYDFISYDEVIQKQLKVIDISATALCKDNNIPIVLFAMDDPNNIERIIKGEKIGTIIAK